MVAEIVAQIASAQMERAVAGDGQVKRRELPRPDGALDCPKCKREGRASFLVERESAGGKFLACAQGKEACGFLSDAPRNAKQRKALMQTPCPACQGA